MRPVVYSLAALLTSVLFLISLRGLRADVGARSQAETTVRPPELEYFKAINQAAPPKDPQLLFLLMAQYSNLNLQGEGAEFFAARFKEFEPRLTDPQKSLYLSATALLRAQHASSVPLLHRIGYVNDTIAMLDRAEQLSGHQVFVVNWMEGVVRSELHLEFLGRARQPRPSWRGAWTTGPKRPTRAGCARSTITSENWLSQGMTERRLKSICKGAATKVEPARYAEHAFLGGCGNRINVRFTPHHRNCAGTRVRFDGIRIHRILLRGIGRWAGTVRYRRRHPAGFGERSL